MKTKIKAASIVLALAASIIAAPLNMVAIKVSCIETEEPHRKPWLMSRD